MISKYLEGSLNLFILSIWCKNNEYKGGEEFFEYLADEANELVKHGIENGERSVHEIDLLGLNDVSSLEECITVAREFDKEYESPLVDRAVRKVNALGLDSSAPDWALGLMREELDRWLSEVVSDCE